MFITGVIAYFGYYTHTYLEFQGRFFVFSFMDMEFFDLL